MASRKDQLTDKYVKYTTKFPVEKNTVYYEAFHLNQIMAGNPYGIFRYLMEHEEYSKLKHIWVFRDEKYLAYDTFSRYKECPNVTFVKAFSNEHLKALATSQYLISNSSLPDYWIKRKGQIYINTWHGTPLKYIGQDDADYNEHAVGNTQRNFLHCDYMALQNRYTIDILLRAYDLTGIMRGKILDTGYPRTDLVVGPDRDRIRGLLEERSGIDLNGKKIVLYAPTFRSEQGGQRKNPIEETRKYVNELLDGLPEGYELFFKAHPTVGKYLENIGQLKERILTDELETNELLSAADILITDYSSIFFDFLCTRRPILFFDYDLDEYIADRGMYLDLDKLPGPICLSTSEVIDHIKKIDLDTFTPDDCYKDFIKRFAYNDDGKAAERLVKIAFDHEEPDSRYVIDSWKDKENILIGLGNANNLINLDKALRVLDKLDYSRQRAFIMCTGFVCLSQYLKYREDDIHIIGSKLLNTSTIAEETKFKEKEDSLPKSFYKRQVRKFFADIPIKEMYILNTTPSALSHAIPCTFVEDAAAVGPKRVPVILCLNSYDSLNSVTAPVIRKAIDRKCFVVPVVYSRSDNIGNKALRKYDIRFISSGELIKGGIRGADVVFTTPMKPLLYKEIWKRIYKNDVPVMSFITLFSSITMRVYPDVVFCIGKCKVDELKKNFLHYNCVITGNPQYDELIGKKKPTLSQQDIKRVLIVDQGGYPFGAAGKQELADTIIQIAKLNPDKQFEIKPRYAPNESGHFIHNLSEHLFNFLGDMPDNMKLLTDTAMLETIVPQYDAMITTWSTAFLDAIAHNIPLILIDGLDSIDVFDVRKQRVAEAYDQLRKSGCVVDYHTLMKEKVDFRYADKDFVEYQIHDLETGCTDKIVDAMIQFKEELSDHDLRISPEHLFSDEYCNIEDFSDYIKNVPKVDKEDPEYYFSKRYAVRLNDRMQYHVYNYRKMGFQPDLSALAEKYNKKPVFDEKVFQDIRAYLEKLKAEPPKENNLVPQDIWHDEYTVGTSKEYLDPMMDKLDSDCNDILKSYFDEHRKNDDWDDEIIQAEYFQWLFRNGNYKGILHFKGTVISEEALEYYTAMVHQSRWNGIAARNHLKIFIKKFLERNGIRKLFIEKDISKNLEPFHEGVIDKIQFYKMLRKNGLLELLEYMEDMDFTSNAVMLYYLLQVLLEKGDYTRARRVYDTYMSGFEKQNEKESRKGINFMVKQHYTKKIQQLYLNAIRDKVSEE